MQIYCCVACGRALADFAPCPDCGGRQIHVKEYGLEVLLDYDAFAEQMPCSIEALFYYGHSVREYPH